MPPTTNPSPRPRIHRRVAATALAGAGSVLLLAACGGAPVTTSASVGPTSSGKGGTVDIQESRYRPEELQVAVGSTVTFVNLDPYDHTVTAREGDPVTFDSGALGQDVSFEMTFDEPGTYQYFCRIHPTMRATVVVGGTP